MSYISIYSRYQIIDEPLFSATYAELHPSTATHFLYEINVHWLFTLLGITKNKARQKIECWTS